MTVYRKCRPCKHRDDCEIKAALSQAIKGFRITTIGHACPSFEADLKPGDNLWVRVQTGATDYFDTTEPAVFPAHFVEYSPRFGRAVVYIRPGATSRDGKHSFRPMKNERGFCRVSYAPYRAKHVYLFDRGIIERREGRTAISQCCGAPAGEFCKSCQEAHEMAQEALA